MFYKAGKLVATQKWLIIQEKYVECVSMIALAKNFQIGLVLWMSIKHFKLMYIIIMSRTRFRLNLQSIVAWMSRNVLLEAGVISEV